MFAVKNSYNKENGVAKLLLESKVDPNGMYDTPIRLYAVGGQEHTLIPVLRKTLNGGFSREKKAPMHRVHPTNYTVFQDLLDAKADVNNRDIKGHTPLGTLLMKSRDPGYKVDQQTNSRIYRAEILIFQSAQTLVSAKADLDTIDNEGRSLLDNLIKPPGDYCAFESTIPLMAVLSELVYRGNDNTPEQAVNIRKIQDMYRQYVKDHSNQCCTFIRAVCQFLRQVC